MTEALQYTEQMSGDTVDWSGVPEHLRGGLDRYITKGIPTGGFLRAVLSNDLAGAIRNGDDESIGHLRGIYQFLYWNVPASCFGDDESVHDWISDGGLHGRYSG